MNGEQQLVASVSIAQGLAEAIASGAHPGDGTPEGQVLREALGTGVHDLGREALDELANRLVRGVRTRADVTQAVLDLTEPVSRLLASGSPIPPALAGLQRPRSDLDEVARGVLGTVAVRRSSAALANQDDEAARTWWQIARDAGHPSALASAHPVRGEPGLQVPVPDEPAGGPNRRRLVAWSVASVVVVALVAWLVALAWGPAERDIPFTLSGFGDACDGAVYPAAPSYEGPPPHPTAALGTDASELPEAGEDKVWTQYPALAPGHALHGVFNPDNLRQVQAVACAEFTGKADPAIKQCDYIDYSRANTISQALGSAVPVSLYPGQYTITVYEARTHRTLARTTVTGNGTDCPENIPTSRYELYSQLTIEQYATVLTPQLG